RLGKRYVKDPLAQTHTFEQELQRQSCFTRTGIALNQIEAVARQPAAKNVIQSNDTRRARSIALRCRCIFRRPTFFHDANSLFATNTPSHRQPKASVVRTSRHCRVGFFLAHAERIRASRSLARPPMSPSCLKFWVSSYPDFSISS